MTIAPYVLAGRGRFVTVERPASHEDYRRMRRYGEGPVGFGSGIWYVTGDVVGGDGQRFREGLIGDFCLKPIRPEGTDEDLTEGLEAPTQFGTVVLAGL